MEKSTDSPGVYLPPPLLYAAFFFAANFIQKKLPINPALLHLPVSKIAGWLILGIAFLFMVTSLRKFFLSKNTLVLIKPASSLQTDGIYQISRNPMYVSLAGVYLGLGCLIGNWWQLMLFPILFLLIQEYIIKAEEKYLLRRFGQEYIIYQSQVRRWL